MDTDGNEHFDEERKGDIAVNYFTNLFKSSTPRSTKELLEGFEAKISERMNQTLTGPVTTGEIKKAIKAVKGDSSPGADGMTGKFFQNYWNITGPQIIKEVKEFFAGGDLAQDWNFTQICLLPKKAKPEPYDRPETYKLVLGGLQNHLQHPLCSSQDNSTTSGVPDPRSFRCWQVDF